MAKKFGGTSSVLAQHTLKLRWLRHYHGKERAMHESFLRRLFLSTKAYQDGRSARRQSAEIKICQPRWTTSSDDWYFKSAGDFGHPVISTPNNYSANLKRETPLQTFSLGGNHDDQ